MAKGRCIGTIAVDGKLLSPDNKNEILDACESSEYTLFFMHGEKPKSVIKALIADEQILGAMALKESAFGGFCGQVEFRKGGVITWAIVCQEKYFVKATVGEDNSYDICMSTTDVKNGGCAQLNSFKILIGR